MMNTVIEKWPEIIEQLRVEHELSNVSFNTWIQPLKVYNVIDNTVFILVNINASVEYIEKKYLLPLKVCISEVTGNDYEVVFLSEDDSRISELKSTSSDSNTKKRTKTASEKAGLNPKYTFDTFVVGSNNNFAHAASLAVAESPGEVYNPLFLYGDVGLGKTHLMHSIAHFILNKNTKKNVLYVTSETFTNELIEALKKGKTADNESAMAQFRDKYRNNDVLLIDDIQFIIGKESTQEEFFHTFNHLHTSGKQIIISSDKPPKDIETLEARLRTRFEWGLIADISAPDYETRMAILRKNAEMYDKEIDDEIIQYIATNIKSNIRELEGALNKVMANARLNKQELNLALAEDALKDVIYPDQRREVSPSLIIDVVAEHFNISKEDITSKKRNSEYVIPRQIIMYLCRHLTDTSLQMIASYLGKKDHTTVIHGVEKIEEKIKTDEDLENKIETIKKKLTPS